MNVVVHELFKEGDLYENDTVIYGERGFVANVYWLRSTVLI